MTDAVRITEVSLRDGLQIEPKIVATKAKTAFARALIASGFTDLEVGSWVSPQAVPSMADTADVVANLAGIHARFHTLAMNEKGAERAIEAGAKNVRLVVSASDGHSRANAGLPTGHALERIRRTAEILLEAGITLEGCIATAFACPFDGDTPIERVEQVAKVYASLGVGVVHLSDTIGAASPGDIRRTVSAVSQIIPTHRLGLHLHDTYGMAAGSAWEGYQQGIRRFDAALGGLGGCPFAPGASGNIAADDLIHMFHRDGIPTGIDVDALASLRKPLADMVGHHLNSALNRVPAAPSALRQPAMPRANRA